MKRGLASAFKKGIDLPMISKDDLIVNIDGDRQYDSEEIPLLIQPIVDGEADIVLGRDLKVGLSSPRASIKK